MGIGLVLFLLGSLFTAQAAPQFGSLFGLGRGFWDSPFDSGNSFWNDRKDPWRTEFDKWVNDFGNFGRIFGNLGSIFGNMGLNDRWHKPTSPKPIPVTANPSQKYPLYGSSSGALLL